ncbi:MAG: universal stress protein [Nitrososphaerota archaeon]|nr:universal stress protein [Nitrososphaerota archaeon]
MFRKILVPIDGSPDSFRGLRSAVGIAKKYDSEIALIHVVERSLFFYADSGMTMIPPDAYDNLEEYAEKLPQKRKRELGEKGIRTETLLKRGDPADQILKASKGFDLIVMGSRGLRRFQRLFLGSVSNSVVQQSRVPVLIVRPE